VPQSSDDDADADDGVGMPDTAQHDRAAARAPTNTRSHPVADMAGLTDRGASVGLSVNRCGWRLLI
jgi:hypothetical protein